MQSASDGAGPVGDPAGGTSRAQQRGIWVLALSFLVLAVLILPNVVEDRNGGDSAGSIALPSGLPSMPNPAASLPSGGAGSSGSPTGAPDAVPGGGGSGGTGGGSVGTAPPAQTTPAPNPTELAFRAVSPGDCLAVYDTGYDDWSSSVPYRVGCGAGNAYVWVSAVRSSTSSCPDGPGQSYWSYSVGGRVTALCLTRQYTVGYCLLAKQTGSGSTAQMNAGLMTVVDCDDKKVPSSYNQILHITGVYKAPANPSSDSCARVAGDRTSYWSWRVNDGKTLLCTMVYAG